MKSERGQSLVEYAVILLSVGALLIAGLALAGAIMAQDGLIRMMRSQGMEVDVPTFPEMLSGLPLTKHATSKHAADHYNALNLPKMWDDDQCIRKSVSYCPKEQNIKAMCEIHPDFWGGIIIGLKDPAHPVIVTAYPGPEAYWMGNIEGCIPMVIP